MSAIPYLDDVLDPDVPVLQLSDVAKKLNRPRTSVEQLLRDGAMFAVWRNGVVSVPEIFLEEEGRVLKGLPGLISVLRDGGYRDQEILEWLFTEDETLPGTPIDALHGNRGKEVTRRAQAMAL
ncbi:Rv2175c family DNA-binding protein [Rhodococcus sp. X156]|uniref:Rv2175c family DNA-binding protein n=1 Tax=Rhodococcus sp. X156 TaxID=2499145 RepID=UPI000FDC9FA2|nr:Rv2175c family DNA-binding protein [Rhodococcus sp. X156]